MDERLQGDQGYLYFGELGTEVTGSEMGTDLTIEGFYKITGKGEASAFPATSGVKDVFFNKPAISALEGDAAKPITLHKLAFVTNVPMGGSKQKFDVTVQTDEYKSSAEGKRAELSGNIDGYFVDAESSGLRDEILERFFRRVTDDGAGAIVYKSLKQGALHLFLTRKETTTVGETEVVQY
ncbi:MAG: hypothetical protein K9L21_05485 [Spirochaetia bacterium]|nr:hypothetical protein [Spirochaetia bacterium]